MPYRAPTGCSAPGCPSTRPCADHPRAWHGRKMPPGWAATRARILRRDRYRCRGCGAPATEVHHAVPGCEESWSLLALCATCHRAISQAQATAARWPGSSMVSRPPASPPALPPAPPSRPFPAASALARRVVYAAPGHARSAALPSVCSAEPWPGRAPPAPWQTVGLPTVGLLSVAVAVCKRRETAGQKRASNPLPRPPSLSAPTLGGPPRPPSCLSSACLHVRAARFAQKRPESLTRTDRDVHPGYQRKRPAAGRPGRHAPPPALTLPAVATGRGHRP